ncbi:Uncharacterised protein [Mycobacteroides abscessus subsp. bolletii]|nr:Uncharacterised protein [Mycobacteroides abscessus]SKF61966.1 Uncharacterised protein [Mycobacteroides abscessus subsp. bolletii]SKH89597.1 Uncharacterised protein [Mycobacteroides abscessus subsp. bolletii]
MSAFMTPTGERVLHRIGYGRVFKVLGVLAVALLVTLAAFFAMTLAAITATGPVSIAGKLVPDAADVFGTGGEMEGGDLAAVGREGDILCRNGATPSSSTAGAFESAAIGPVADSSAATTTSTPPNAIEPIPVNADGSISKADAQRLVDPVLPGTSALQADVWFMYRLAGLGDWDTFTAAYRAAGLREDDESPDAPLQQVQLLNSRGVDMEPYRLTAAALTSAGEVTGRLEDPYSGFRDLIVTELVSGCFDDDQTSLERSALPPPVVTSSTATAPPVVEQQIQVQTVPDSQPQL